MEVPERTCDQTGKQQRNSRGEIEHTEGGAPQLGRRGICYECRENPLGEAHVQPPKRHPQDNSEYV